MQRTPFFSILAAAVLTVGSLLGVSASAAGPAVSITLNPTSATLTSDDTQVFTVIATDKDGVTTDVTSASTLSSNDPLGSLTGSTYNAGEAGTWSIKAEYQSFTATASVTVTAGALQEITINPHSDPEFVNLGTTKTFRADGFDAASNPVGNLTVSWAVIGEIGTINDQGVFTPSKIGTGKVTATSGAIAAEIPVVVKEAPTEPTNTNASTNTNTAGSNTNAATNGNANVNAGDENANANENANTNTAGASTDDNATTEECTTLSTWVWVLILIAYLIAVGILYALMPVSKIWPAIAGLGGALVLVIVHRNTACDLMAWWPWVISLGTLGLTVLALRQLPGPKPNNQ